MRKKSFSLYIYIYTYTFKCFIDFFVHSERDPLFFEFPCKWYFGENYKLLGNKIHDQAKLHVTLCKIAKKKILMNYLNTRFVILKFIRT